MVQTVAESDVDVCPLYLATTLNSYTVSASRYLTIRFNLLSSLVSLQSLLVLCLRYFMTYVRSAELVTPAGGVILSATAESLNSTMPGGLIDPSVATQRNAQRLRITNYCQVIV